MAVRDYFIVADYPAFDRGDGVMVSCDGCLVYNCGTNKEFAEQILNKILTDHDEQDLREIAKGATNFRIESEESDDCWWNDSFLAN